LKTDVIRTLKWYNTGVNNMKLVAPTDLEILDTLSVERHTTGSIAEETGIRSKYVSERLTQLRDHGYVLKPYEKSPLVELTDRGKVAAEHLDAYDRTRHDTWSALIDRVLVNQPNDEFLADLVALTPDEIEALNRIHNHSNRTGSPAKHADIAAPTKNVTIDVAVDIADKLQFFNLVEPDESGGYRVTDRGRKFLQLDADTWGNPVETTRQVRQ